MAEGIAGITKSHAIVYQMTTIWGFLLLVEHAGENGINIFHMV